MASNRIEELVLSLLDHIGCMLHSDNSWMARTTSTLLDSVLASNYFMQQRVRADYVCARGMVIITLHEHTILIVASLYVIAQLCDSLLADLSLSNIVNIEQS